VTVRLNLHGEPVVGTIATEQKENPRERSQREMSASATAILKLGGGYWLQRAGAEGTGEILRKGNSLGVMVDGPLRGKRDSVHQV